MSIRVIISGGGTGGHIFPALSIGSELKARDSKNEILYVGAVGGMEMTLVPKNGFPIEGVTITGLKRPLWHPKSILKNLGFPLKLMRSLNEAKAILKKFKPDIVVGVGGYASGPLGRAAASMGIPLVICEQNAYPGITNKWLAPKSKVILLGNEAARKHFSGFNVKTTGNPVRANLVGGSREAGLKAFGLDPAKPVIVSLGGSLGAGTLNRALEKDLQKFQAAGVQLVWQCGKRYYDEIRARVPQTEGLVLAPFIENMPDTFAMADLVISRAGGSTISELILLSKPSILVPSPNVAEDHQTQNALSLVNSGAAVLVKDADAEKSLVEEALAILKNKSRLEKIQAAVSNMKKHDSAKEIVDEILAIAGKK